MSISNKSTLLGSVQDVNGTSVSVKLIGGQSSGLTFVEGQGYRIGQVGSFVKIPIGYIDLFGIVSQVGARSVPENIAILEPDGYRWLTIQLIGEGYSKGKFQRGISQYPTIEDEVHLVSEYDLAKIYGGDGRQNHMVRVGHIAGSESIDALVDINKLVTRHSAIVGTTGSGKSTTVAGLLNSLSDPQKFPSARIIVLDIHGEYGKALSDRANVYKINPETSLPGEALLNIPYWAMSFDELISITFGQIDDKDKGFIMEKIVELKKATIENARILNADSYKGISLQNLNVDSPVPFSLNRLWLYLHRLISSTHTVQGTGQIFGSILIDTPSGTTEAFEKDSTGKPQIGDAENVIAPVYQTQIASKIFLSGINLNIRRSLDNLASKLRDSRYDFLFKPTTWRPDLKGKVITDLPQLMELWIGAAKPISVLDLSGVPNSVMNSIIGILLRIIYDGLFWARNLPEGGKERPLLIVMEEAHAYLNDDLEGLASSVVQKIVKEGRKYGIGAMIVSQRPSEINPTILSQCGTFFSLRLSNQTDRSHIKGAISDNLDGLTDMLPILRTGEAIILGEAVKMPMRTIIEAPPKDRRPDSQDPVVCSDLSPDFSFNIPGGWDSPKSTTSDYEKFVEVWRKQNPKVANSLKDKI